jgi:hypothetical protein
VCDGRPTGFARSLSKDGAGPEVRQLYVSDLARHMDEVITVMDEYEKQHPEYAATNPVVRLLFVPSYQTYVFWLRREEPGGLMRRLMAAMLNLLGFDVKASNVRSDVFVISAPQSLTPLVHGAMLDSNAFLEAFRDEEPLAGGLV